MLERILPPGVVVKVAPAGRRASPYPEEEALVARAVAKRRQEFLAGRDCARAALAELGLPPQPILSGPKGEPLWPAGIVGSITHCDGYLACAVAPAASLWSLGVDAEPDLPLPDRVLADVALPQERAQLKDLARAEPGPHWDRLLFCLKEAVYKAWFPLAGRWLGFEDALVTVDPATRTFTARLLVPGPTVEGEELCRLEGRLAVAEGFLLAAVALPRRASAATD